MTILTMLLISFHTIIYGYALSVNRFTHQWIRGLMMVLFGLSLVSLYWLGSDLIGSIW